MLSQYAVDWQVPQFSDKYFFQPPVIFFKFVGKLGQCWVKKAKKSPEKPINEGFSGYRQLFKLNRAGRLGRDVIEAAVDAGDLVGDPVGDLIQQFPVYMLDGRGDRVFGIDGADDAGPFKSSLSVLDAGRLEGRNDREVLPDRLVEACLGELFAEDGVGLPDRFQSVTGDGTGAADAQAGARERLAVYHGLRQAQGPADHADFVFIEKLDRLDQLQLHILGKASHVVMGFDTVLGLQDIRIDGALAQEADSGQFGSLFIKNFNELTADNLSLLLGFLNACQQIPSCF